MQSIIKEVREVQSKDGTKTFYEVKFQDGAEASTFDAKMKQAVAGDSLEWEADIKGKYVNIKDGWKLTKNASSTGEFPKANGYQMSKEEWAEKDRLKRQSIEAQAAATAVLAYAASVPELSKEDEIIVDKALAWCEAKIDADMGTPAAKPTTTPPALAETKEPSDVEFDNTPIKNLGELWSRCKNYDISKAEGLELAGVKDQGEIIDLDEAWKTIFRKKFGKIEWGKVT